MYAAMNCRGGWQGFHFRPQPITLPATKAIPDPIRRRKDSPPTARPAAAERLMRGGQNAVGCVRDAPSLTADPLPIAIHGASRTHPTFSQGGRKITLRAGLREQRRPTRAEAGRRPSALPASNRCKFRSVSSAARR